MAKHNHCPYCGAELVYKDIAADIDNITEKWWCPNCKEDVEFDEPGLRKRKVAELRFDYQKMIAPLTPYDLEGGE